jgi:hypothetical protein
VSDPKRVGRQRGADNREFQSSDIVAVLRELGLPVKDDAPVEWLTREEFVACLFYEWTP